MKKLLISACDAAAAFHLAEVAGEAARDARFHLEVVAQGPARAIFAATGIQAQIVELPRAKELRGVEADALRAAAQTILDAKRPDVLLCGLSSPGDGGIDEALLASRNCPAFLFQDFWGEANSFFGRGADSFFVMDESAAKLSWTRHRVKSTVVGSPRHTHSGRLASDEQRTHARARAGLNPGQPTIGVFGQSLHGVAGYGRTLIALSKAISALGPDVAAFYRPHPRESDDDAARAHANLADAGIRVDRIEGALEEALLVCDVAATPFSNCLLDAAYLNHFSATPLMTPSMLLFDPEIYALYHKLVTDLDAPYRRDGIAVVLESEANLEADLKTAFAAQTRNAVWNAARTALASPVQASNRILDVLAAAS